jgi:hypothetical protein
MMDAAHAMSRSARPAKRRWAIAGAVTVALLVVLAAAVVLFIRPRIDLDIPRGVQVVPVRLAPGDEIVRNWANLQFDVGPNGVPLVAATINCGLLGRHHLSQLR